MNGNLDGTQFILDDFMVRCNRGQVEGVIKLFPVRFFRLEAQRIHLTLRIRYRAALVLAFAAEPHIEPNFPAGNGPLVPVSLGRFRGGVAERRPLRSSSPGRNR